MLTFLLLALLADIEFWSLSALVSHSDDLLCSTLVAGESVNDLRLVLLLLVEELLIKLLALLLAVLGNLVLNDLVHLLLELLFHFLSINWLRDWNWLWLSKAIN